MSQCAVQRRRVLADGWFLAAPGALADDAWPVHEAHIERPVPLCHWHALLLGDQRVAPPH